MSVSCMAYFGDEWEWDWLRWRQAEAVVFETGIEMGKVDPRTDLSSLWHRSNDHFAMCPVLSKQSDPIRCHR